MWDAVVVGAGQAGLAAGYHLQKAGLRFLILEASDKAAGSWPNYYDSLRLFSPVPYASLPGRPFPGKKDHYPTRDEVISYLTHYAAQYQFPIHYHSKVLQVKKDREVFHLTTASGQRYEARAVIAATGSFSRPYLPRIDNESEYTGVRLHSAAYQSPEPFAGKRVIVAGRGNSAVQIALELTKVAETILAVREPVSLLPQRVLGKDLHFWLQATGLDTFPFWRLGKNAGRTTPVIDPGGYRERLDQGNPPQKPMFTRFDREGVMWPDGTQSPADAVIFATGFQPNIAYLDSLPARDSQGNPLQRAGVSTVVQGLYYVGLSGQRSIASATIRGVGADARYVVRHLVKVLNGRKINIPGR